MRKDPYEKGGIRGLAFAFTDIPSRRLRSIMVTMNGVERVLGKLYRYEYDNIPSATSSEW